MAMTPIVEPSAPGVELALDSYRPLLSVVVAVVGEDGTLVDGNAGFRRLLERCGYPSAREVASFFVLPRFDQLAATLAGPDGTVHCGVINVGDVNATCFSLTGTVRRSGRNLILMAEFDVAEMEALNAQVLHLNEDLAGVQRELVRYQRHLEELVAARTQSLSIAKEAAEAASRAKSTFMVKMSHELFTPMNAIMGMTGIALRRAGDPELQETLGKVDHASRHLLGILKDILDLASIEADRLSLEHVPFRLRAVIEPIQGLITRQAAEKGLQLGIDLPPAIAGLALRGDPGRLGQILLNLVDNAVKFTPAGSVGVRVRVAEESPSHVLLRWEVWDTGIGIAAEDQKRLFTPFEQADGSLTRKYGGTGLGLALSKRLAQLMGGEMGMESQAGQGSTFWFMVRLARDIEASGDAKTRIRAEHAGARVLLVEAEPFNQEIVRFFLEEVGLSVDLAEDGVAAVELARHKPYALILMDLEMAGVDLAGVVRARNGQTPIVALTAGEAGEAGLAPGVDDQVAKPIESARLYEALLKWL
jgi:signal transduction histidine kinase